MDKRVPEVRFKGFTDDCEQHLLGEHSVIKGRLGWKSLKKDEYTIDGPSMIAGKHINNGIINWDEVDHIPEWRYEESPEIMLKNGDVIFSKDGSLGNPALISNLKTEATINSTMMLVRTDDDINSRFFYQVLTGDTFKKMIYLKVSGSSIPHLFQADMATFKFHAPNYKNQEKISNLLNVIDNLYVLQQNKLNLYEKLKKGLLQKVLSENDKKVPNVRFKGFTSYWEKKKVKDIFKITRGQVLASNKVNQKQSNTMIYPVYSSQTKSDGLMGYYSEYLFDKAITWTTDGANAGTVNYRNGKFFSTNVNGVLISNSGYTNQAIAEIINRIAWKWVSHVGNPKLMNNVMGDILINIPNTITEMEILSKFINNIDLLINIQNKNIQNLKSLKKYYLQKLFI